MQVRRSSKRLREEIPLDYLELFDSNEDNRQHNKSNKLSSKEFVMIHHSIFDTHRTFLWNEYLYYHKTNKEYLLHRSRKMMCECILSNCSRCGTLESQIGTLKFKPGSVEFKTFLISGQDICFDHAIRKNENRLKRNRDNKIKHLVACKYPTVLAEIISDYIN